MRHGIEKKVPEEATAHPITSARSGTGADGPAEAINLEPARSFPVWAHGEPIATSGVVSTNEQRRRPGAASAEALSCAGRNAHETHCFGHQG